MAVEATALPYPSSSFEGLYIYAVVWVEFLRKNWPKWGYCCKNRV